MEREDTQALQEAFRQATASDEHRRDFAESLGALVNEVLPAESTVRSIFIPEVLPDGATPVYSSDVQGPINAWLMPKFGQAPVTVVELEEVTASTDEIIAQAHYKLRDARMGRIDVAARTRARLLDGMVLKEETYGWDLIRAAAASRTVSVSGANGFTKDVANAAFLEMESNRGYTVTDVYMGPKAAADARMWKPTDIDPVTQREVLQTGAVPGIWQANFHTVHFLDDNEVFFLDQRQNKPNPLGYMPIRTEVQTFDDPTAINKLRAGVIAYEEVGFVVMDAKNIVKASLTYA